jgi:phosphoribosylpyrophosphate synthetase
MNDDFLIFAGTANPLLAASVARALGVRLGRSAVDRFPDGELTVTLLDGVRGKEVFIVHSTAPPVNERLVPYFGYARADKRHGRREPITGSMVAELFEAVGVNHLITIDLHAPQIEGFFHIPVDSLTAVGLLSSAMQSTRFGRTARATGTSGSSDLDRTAPGQCNRTSNGRWLDQRVVVERVLAFRGIGSGALRCCLARHASLS